MKNLQAFVDFDELKKREKVKVTSGIRSIWFLWVQFFFTWRFELLVRFLVWFDFHISTQFRYLDGVFHLFKSFKSGCVFWHVTHSVSIIFSSTPFHMCVVVLCSCSSIFLSFINQQNIEFPKISSFKQIFLDFFLVFSVFDWHANYYLLLFFGCFEKCLGGPFFQFRSCYVGRLQKKYVKRE